MNSNGGAIGISSTSTVVELAIIKEIEKDNHSESNDPSLTTGKGEVEVIAADSDQDHILLSHEEQFPEDPDGEVETQQFTSRAVLVGCILGGVIAASK